MSSETDELGNEEFLGYGSEGQSPALKKLQEVQIGILEAFSRHCEQHGLNYFLVAGTALGAKRHGGMIPWDDDIDIAMLRPDYDRLVVSLASQPLEGLFFQTYKTDSQTLVSYAKLRKDNTVFHEPLVEELDTHKGIFIDIFPYDKAFKSPYLRRLQCLCLSPLHLINSSATRNICSVTPNPIIRLIRYCFYFARPIVPVSLVRRFQESIMRIAGPINDDAELVGCFDIYGERKYEKSVTSLFKILPTAKVKFDRLVQPVPKDIDHYLTQTFGDYMRLPEPADRKPAHAEAVRFCLEK